MVYNEMPKNVHHQTLFRDAVQTKDKSDRAQWCQTVCLIKSTRLGFRTVHYRAKKCIGQAIQLYTAVMLPSYFAFSPRC